MKRAVQKFWQIVEKSVTLWSQMGLSTLERVTFGRVNDMAESCLVVLYARYLLIDK